MLSLVTFPVTPNNLQLQAKVEFVKKTKKNKAIIIYLNQFISRIKNSLGVHLNKIPSSHLRNWKTNLKVLTRFNLIKMKAFCQEIFVKTFIQLFDLRVQRFRNIHQQPQTKQRALPDLQEGPFGLMVNRPYLISTILMVFSKSPALSRQKYKPLATFQDNQAIIFAYNEASRKHAAVWSHDVI